MKSSYSYTVLRYFHDTTTGEFLNVGVGLYAPDRKFAAAICRRSSGRVAKVFPGVDSRVFKTLMLHIQRKFEKFGKRLEGEFAFEAAPTSVMDIAQNILPKDDSSLQWSPPGGGLTENPENTLESLFDRLVTKYDDKVQRASRSDEDVWRAYRRTLESRNLLGYLKPKKFVVEDDEVEFSNAWKNGVWHCLEPLSFDLSSADSIRDKAHKWLGHLISVQKADEPFKVYFLLGEPSQSDLSDAVDKAISILEKLPVDKDIIREQNADRFSQNFADEIERHQLTH